MHGVLLVGLPLVVHRENNLEDWFFWHSFFVVDF